jgi:hypothetical protein
MDDFDLDIQNYSNNDLLNFFQLNKQKEYEPSDIEEVAYTIQHKFTSNPNINKKFCSDFIKFVESAKQKIVEFKCKKQLLKKPTSIPANYKLDQSQVSYAPDDLASRHNEIVERPVTQYVHSSPSEFLPGNMNPLKTRVISKCLNIDTKFRDNYYYTSSSDFTLQLPTKFNKVVSMKLSSLEFPVSFYSISESFGNNFLYMQTNYYPISDDGVDLSGNLYTKETVLTIPDGNYNSDDLISKLNELISARDENGSLVDANDPFAYIQFSLDITSSGSGTGKVTIAPSGIKSSAIKTITLDFTKNKNKESDNTEVSSRFGWNLGFTQRKYRNKNTYTGDTVIEPATTRYLYLAVDDFQNNSNNHFVSVFKNSVMSPNILARISLKASYFSLLMENDFNIISEPRNYFGPVDIQRLRIRIYDERGNILNMNNANFSFCLDFKMLYDL